MLRRMTDDSTTIQQPTEKRQNMVGVWWLTPLHVTFMHQNICALCHEKDI
jgi:hypothetical protein